MFKFWHLCFLQSATFKREHGHLRVSFLLPLTYFSLVLLGIGFVSTPAMSAQGQNVLQCPSVLSTQVEEEKYTGWEIYCNNPLRLTGADIAYAEGNLDATLDPNETKRLNDDHLSTLSVYRFRIFNY